MSNMIKVLLYNRAIDIYIHIFDFFTEYDITFSSLHDL